MPYPSLNLNCGQETEQHSLFCTNLARIAFVWTCNYLLSSDHCVDQVKLLGLMIRAKDVRWNLTKYIYDYQLPAQLNSNFTCQNLCWFWHDFLQEMKRFRMKFKVWFSTYNDLRIKNKTRKFLSWDQDDISLGNRISIGKAMNVWSWSDFWLFNFTIQNFCSI